MAKSVRQWLGLNGVTCPGLMLVLTLVSLSYAIEASGQSGRRIPSDITSTNQGQTADDIDLIRIKTEEVLVPVSVRDSTGAPVEGLSAENFFIYDDGERQEITSFNRRRAPANIVLLLDASGSVFSRMRFIRTAAKGFLKGLLPEDNVSIMQFADRVELLQDWTPGSDLKRLDQALSWRYHPGENTAFFDGLYLAAEEQLSRVEGRRIVILLTDGIDAVSRKHASYTDALNAIRRREATVYVVSLTAGLRADIEKREGGRWGRIFGGYNPRQLAYYKRLIDEAEKNLGRIASETGGRMFLPLEEEKLAEAYSTIAEELRTQYIVTYRPKRRAAAGEYRRIRVLVAPGGFDVAARDGYVGRA